VKTTVLTTKTPTTSDILVELTSRLAPNILAITNTEHKSLTIGSVVESSIDLEGLYTLTEALKFYGSSDVQFKNFRSFLNVDSPNFYTLNRSFNSLNALSALLMIGTNPRFEASLLNTNLRKQQLTRDLSYFSVGPYAALKVKHNHLGVSIKSLISIIENKTPATKSLTNTKGTSVFLGVESLKGKNGAILQNVARLLSKKLFLKTKNGERLGYLHSTTTSLVFSTLGVLPSVRSTLYTDSIKDKKLDILFAIQPYTLNEKK